LVPSFQGLVAEPESVRDFVYLNFTRAVFFSFSSLFRFAFFPGPYAFSRSSGAHVFFSMRPGGLIPPSLFPPRMKTVLHLAFDVFKVIPPTPVFWTVQDPDAG